MDVIFRCQQIWGMKTPEDYQITNHPHQLLKLGYYNN